MTFAQQLVEVGHARAEADRIAALSPVEKMRALPVIGNAWSDGPLLQVLYYVLAAGSQAEQFEAMRKLNDTVGADQPAADAELQAQIDQLKQHLAEREVP